MKSFFSFFYTLSVTVLLCQCSLLQKEDKKEKFSYPPELQEVHSLILEKKTEDARVKVNDYLNRAENIHWYGHAYFLKGFLYELDENFPAAIRHYRSSVQHGSAYDSAVEAKALYNLSFVYERVGQLSDMLVTLVDLMKRREFFDILTGQVEIPARLAAAYASQGKMREARIFHREASQNFATLVRSQRFQGRREEISKSLYYLGFITFDQNEESFPGLVEKISLGQKYFLAAAEASASSWSQKAADRLGSQYDRAWAMIGNFKPKGFDHDPLAFKKQKHRRQLIMASDLYDLMHRLRAEEFPMSNVNARSQKIIGLATQWIERIEKFAIQLQVGPETTRSQKIHNKPLALYIEEQRPPVKINKESQVKPTPEASSRMKEPSSKEDSSIGKDPNL